MANRPTKLSPRWIKALRKRLRLTQEDMASAIGLSGKFTVSRWENGRHEPQRVHRRALLALAKGK